VSQEQASTPQTEAPPETPPALAEAPAAAGAGPSAAGGPAACDARFEAPVFAAPGSASEMASFELLDDVELEVKVELGRTELYLEDVLKLGVGSVVELDKLAGDPVDIYVNQRLVARGEVLVLNDSFCVRVNDILSPIPEFEGYT